MNPVRRTIKNVQRKAKRVIFAVGKKPLPRDSTRGGILSFPRIIWKTPKVRRKRLAIKTPEEKREAVVRKAVREFHKHAETQTYTLKLSKRFPPVKGKRTEIYYDMPTLRDLIEKNTHRRMKKFLKENRISSEKAQEMALSASEEAERNVFRAAQDLSPDYEAHQFMVEGMDKKGRLKLIMVDI